MCEYSNKFNGPCCISRVRKDLKAQPVAMVSRVLLVYPGPPDPRVHLERMVTRSVVCNPNGS